MTTLERTRAPPWSSIKAGPVVCGNGDQEGGSAAENGSTRISSRSPGGKLHRREPMRPRADHADPGAFRLSPTIDSSGMRRGLPSTVVSPC